MQQSVQAANTTRALELAKRRFGPDALILGTRNVLDARGERAVEVMVSTDGTPLRRSLEARGIPAVERYREVEEASLKAEPETMSPDAPLEDRMDSILGRIQRLADSLPEEEPLLHRRLRKLGAGDPGIQALAVAGGGEAELVGMIQCLPENDFSRLRGEHWFCGRPGAGKSALIWSLAAELCEHRRAVGVLVLSPPDPAALMGMGQAAQRLGISACAPRDDEELAAARENLSDCEVLLVDAGSWLEWPLAATPSAHATIHLVHPLADDPSLLLRQLESEHALEVDALALSQSDLLPTPGRILDLLAIGARPLSFLSERARGQQGIEPALPGEIACHLLGRER